MLSEYFNRIASSYDQAIQEIDRLKLFPYAGYEEMMDRIAKEIMAQLHLNEYKILDIGIGTGQLYQKIKPELLKLTGVDFSKNMLEIAKLRLPSSTFFLHDFVQGLPKEIQDEKFDFIVSTFCMHHLDIDKYVDMIHYLLNYLTPFGKIYIGDILFLDEESKKRCYKSSSDIWDESEYYHVFNQLLQKVNSQLKLSFMKISFCVGIIIIENYHECTLQFEENLVEYSQNTMKWKSSQARKKRE